MATLVQNSAVWEIHDNFQKQTYRNRYHICTDRGLHKLSIPVKHTKNENGHQKYQDVRIETEDRWQIRHWRTLQTAYRTSPFFEFYEDDLAPLFQKKFAFLLDFNWHCLEFLIAALQITYSKEQTIQFETDYTQGMDMRGLVNAKKRIGISFTPYHQVFSDRHGFIPNMSTLDLIFNEGPQARTYLKNLSLTHA